MCPSYRVTRNERDVTRGRANTLRLAITGQLGPDALTSDEMAETLKLCVSCKACRRECPTGVDMARMKIEVQAARAQKHGLSLRDRLVGWLPRYAPYAAKAPWLFNLRDRMPGARRAVRSARRLQRARAACRAGARDVFAIPAPAGSSGEAEGREVVLFADTFNRYFERENLDAAVACSLAGGYRVHFAKPANGAARPLCCGRTFLSIGRVDRGAARSRARRSPRSSRSSTRGVPILGLEPSCLSPSATSSLR